VSDATQSFQNTDQVPAPARAGKVSFRNGDATTTTVRANRIMKNSNLALIAVMLPLAATVACNRNNVQAAGPGMPPPLVTVAKATVQDVPRYLDEIGHNTAFESVMITPQVGGRITERHFADGENLTKGQLLFVIDPRPYKAQVDAAQANLAQAKAALELAKIQFARDEAVIEQRAISKQDYDTKKSTVDVDQAQVEADEAALETANLNLEYCYIHSPIDGRAGARLVDVGNVVLANASSLLSIQRLDPIYANFTITEGDLPAVQKQISGGSMSAGVRLPSDPETAARKGRLEFLDNAVQNGSGTVTLRATLKNADHHFWPGQFVDVKLVLATEKKAVLIPNDATQISQQGPFVYVVKSDDTAELRPVKLGQRQGPDVVVTDGVAPNERVVLAGQLLVRPGGKVHVISDVAAGSASPTSKTNSAAGGQS
jgi:membrane fusion protein, multidrug efflux system